jgi:putative ABC transport system permease protein
MQVRRGTNAMLARVADVTPGTWDVLGLHPRLGDWHATDAAESAVVISSDLFERLGGDPAIVGREISIDGVDRKVVAVARPRFRALHLDRVVDDWLPLDPSAQHGRGDRELRLFGRLGSATLDSVQSRLNAVATRLGKEHPDTNVGTVRNPDEPRRLTVLRYSRIDPAARSRASLLGAILLTATALLLLSACVNAGSLLLSRGLARRAELTIKSALGADRARLVRAFLLESARQTGYRSWSRSARKSA